MDPNANIDEQLQLARSILARDDAEYEHDEHDTSRLAELVVALDEWLTSGGFPPARWRGER